MKNWLLSICLFASHYSFGQNLKQLHIDVNGAILDECREYVKSYEEFTKSHLQIYVLTIQQLDTAKEIAIFSIHDLVFRNSFEYSPEYTFIYIDSTPIVVLNKTQIKISDGEISLSKELYERLSFSMHPGLGCHRQAEKYVHIHDSRIERNTYLH